MNKSREPGVAGRFKRGDDPRRNKNGRKSKAAIQMSQALMNALTAEGEKDEKFKKLATKIWEKALQGQPWAVEMIFDRLIGKVTQPVKHNGDINAKLIIEVVETE